jgi:catechol 2,3-dioxygenase-like lactoylglutathione lyase family enzyme
MGLLSYPIYPPGEFLALDRGISNNGRKRLMGGTQMGINYQTALIFVKDVGISRDFYEKYLEQKVEYDFGENVSFQGGLAIHDASHIAKLLSDGTPPGTDEKPGRPNFELYFEADDLDAIYSRLVDFGVTLVHPLREQPWGQRVIRFYDPDHHMVEIGEPIPVFVGRYLEEGLSVAEVAERTSIPIEGVRQIQAEINKQR